MRFMTTSLCALVLAMTAITPVSAGWDNVFQPTLFCKNRQPATTAKYYAPPVMVSQSSPCRSRVRTLPTAMHDAVHSTQLLSACASVETKTEMVPVTTYRTSYYYEPVTTVRYSSYYDPCTCSYGQVAVPRPRINCANRVPGAKLGVALRASAGDGVPEGRLLATANDLLPDDAQRGLRE